MPTPDFTTARATDEWLRPVLRELLPAALLREVERRCDGSLWRAAVDAGATTDDALVAAVARRSRMPATRTLDASPNAAAHLPEQLARRYGVLPLTVGEGTLDVATGNPYDLDCEQVLAFVAGRRVRMTLASPTRIAERLDEVYRPERAVERMLAGAPPPDIVHLQDPTELDAETGDAAARDRPVVRLVDHIVAEGIALRASDIHLEPAEEAIAVRYRVDGVLRPALTLPRTLGLPLVSRIKIMAGMDIADRLRPQGGRAAVTVQGARVDLRVSTLPAAHGEKVVVRVLDSRAGVRTLDELGLQPSEVTDLGRLLAARDGLILVTGPTGSGKTTTLYAALRQLLSRGLNIVTVEDPVEYRIAGIVQVQVNERAGLTFAAALRSILRQDPDVILIGEVRDAETAQIALQAALTGHLVFATLHTIDAASSVARMNDLGAEPAKVAAALRGVLAQRLVRRICDSCARRSTAPVHPVLWDRIPSGAELREGAGCRACGGAGYRGRLAVIELATLTPPLAELVARGVPAALLREGFRDSGTDSLWTIGVGHVLAGDTTADEIVRALQPDGAERQADGDSSRRGELPSGARPYLADASRADVSPPRLPQPASLVTPDAAVRTDVGVVDVYLVDPSTVPWRALVLQRSAHTRCPGAWEVVHGHIEPGEAPEDAAVREVREETGLTIERLYNVTVHAFYLHRQRTVELAVVFCAFVSSAAAVQLGSEHAHAEWLPIDRAPARCIWPRATQAFADIQKLLGAGHAGPAEDVLRVR